MKGFGGKHQESEVLIVWTECLVWVADALSAWFALGRSTKGTPAKTDRKDNNKNNNKWKKSENYVLAFFLFCYLRSLIKEKLSLFHLHYQLKLPKVNDALLSALDKSCRKGGWQMRHENLHLKSSIRKKGDLGFCPCLWFECLAPLCSWNKSHCTVTNTMR